jgi:hypothetical protein
MKLLLEGSLSETLTLKDLLVGILQAEVPGVSVLQLSIDGVEQYGEMFFLGGHFVVGASLCEADLAAEEALNHLLQLKEAKCRYYACNSLEALPANKPLKIDLRELIDNWQIKQPLSSNDLLDQIFNKIETSPENENISSLAENEKEIIQESTRHSTKKDQIRSSFTDKQSDIDWELVNPLLLGGAPGDKGISSIGSQLEENAYSTQELRSLATGRDWQRKLRNLILIVIMSLIVLLVAFCFIWLLMNSPSSEVSPRRYPITPLQHGSRKTQNLSHTLHHTM